MDELVLLRVYDLSRGRVARLAPLVMWKEPIRGIWHTAIYVYGYEYFFAGYIAKMRPQQVEASLGFSASHTIPLGRTKRSHRDFELFLARNSSKFTPSTYDLESWNCNNFSNEMSRFLLNGTQIPREILTLPQRVNASWVGRIVMKILKARSENPILTSQRRSKSQGSSSRTLVRRSSTIRRSTLMTTSPLATKAVATKAVATKSTRKPLPPM